MVARSLMPHTWLLVLGLCFSNRVFGVMSGGLASRFSIDGPTFEFDDDTIYLDYVMSTFATIENLHHAFYDWDCRQKVTEELSPLVAESLTKGELFKMMDEDERRQWRIPLRLKDTTKGKQEICFRWMIFTGPPSDPNSIEVNFMQTQLSIASAGGKISNVETFEKKIGGVKVILPGGDKIKAVKLPQDDNNELAAEL